MTKLHLNRLAADTERRGAESQQAHRRQRQHDCEEIPHRNLKFGAEKQILWISYRCGHAAQVCRYRLKHNKIRQTFLPSDQLQHQDSKRDKCKQSHIVSNEHARKEGQQDQRQAEDTEAFPTDQQTLGQDLEKSSLLQSSHHQHQTKQQREHPYIQVAQIGPVRRHKQHGHYSTEEGDAQHRLPLCEPAQFRTDP